MTGNISLVEVSRTASAHSLDIPDMSQVDLAAALNVTQSAVSQWASGARKPAADVVQRLDRARDADNAAGRMIDVGLRRGPVKIPCEVWEPAFSPRGQFRLPLHLDWSGTPQQRWRDACDIDSVLMAYVQVMVDGSIADIVTWVDPKILARHADLVLWPRGYEQPWRDALASWGLL